MAASEKSEKSDTLVDKHEGTPCMYNFGAYNGDPLANNTAYQQLRSSLPIW